MKRSDLNCLRRELTAQQQRVLQIIEAGIARGNPPTRREIASAMGFRSGNAADEHVLRDLPARHQAAEDAKAWVDLFWRVAKELNCLPSSFVDGNEHVLRAARQARAARTAQKSEGEAC